MHERRSKLHVDSVSARFVAHVTLPIIVFLTTGCACVLGGDPHPSVPQTFRINEENDAFGGSGDAQYTNGIRLGLERGKVPTWLRNAFTSVAQNGMTPGMRGWASRWTSTRECADADPAGGHCLSTIGAISQTMYTPVEKHRIAPDTTDRPYAGVLMYTEGIRRQSDRDATQLELGVGVLGPSSKAEFTQTFVHQHIAHVAPFDGWKNQIPDQIALNVLARRRRRFVSQEAPLIRLAFDVTPRGEGVFGTTFIYLAAGTQVRAGWHLSPEWGGDKMSETNPQLRAAQLMAQRRIPSDSANNIVAHELSQVYHFELSGVFESEGRAVARNATLDATPRTANVAWVRRKPLVGEYAFGLSSRIDLGWYGKAMFCGHVVCPAYYVPNLSLSYRLFHRSDEFSGPYVSPDPKRHSYGVWSLGLSRSL